ncbi:hypothetical protein [Conexibacter woesei]|uniref:hypothetical protein n=1 Tax=Conexibacter woesei TaxID=191495 RepID=UPI0011D213A5|nr:hypothetical protein [Conexibacter woesei]
MRALGDRVVRLELTTGAAIRAATFAVVARFADCRDDGLLFETRIARDGDATVRAIDPAGGRIRAVPEARAAVAGTRLAVDVPLAADTELDRGWIVWSMAIDGRTWDSVPAWDGVEDAGVPQTTPDRGSGCLPEIRLVR